jgi:hypothetical protein
VHLGRSGVEEQLDDLARRVAADDRVVDGDDLGAGNWVDFVKWTTSAYLISRGIAKASRVLEQ